MYHHFLGMDDSDSELDMLLYSGPPGLNESLVSYLCSKEDSSLCSHHDLIVRQFPVLSCD